MADGHFDATILLEEPSHFEFKDGLFYITDRVGSLVIRRCLRPSTMYRHIAAAVAVSREHRLTGAKVVPMRPDQAERLAAS